MRQAEITFRCDESGMRPKTEMVPFAGQIKFMDTGIIVIFEKLGEPNGPATIYPIAVVQRVRVTE